MWTRWLRIVVVACSVVFTIGTALHGFVVIDQDVMIRTMTLAGQSPAEAAANAPGFLTGFRVVGAVFVVGNALGLLAMRAGNWLFWVVLAINAGQAAGVWMVPFEMFEAIVADEGWISVLPSVVTDGGALILVIVMLGTVLRAVLQRRLAGSARPTGLPERSPGS